MDNRHENCCTNLWKIPKGPAYIKWVIRNRLWDALIEAKLHKKTDTKQIPNFHKIAYEKLMLLSDSLASFT